MINSLGCSTPCMCLPAPPVSPSLPLHHHSLPLRLHWFLSQTNVVLALFSHSEPLYLHISKGWSCHGVVPLPVTITVNMGAQCLEAIRFVHVLLYLNMSLTPTPPPPQAFFSSPPSSCFPSLSPPLYLSPFSVGVKNRCVWAQCTVCVLFVPMLPVSLGLSPLSVLCAGGGNYWCLSVRTCGTLVTPIIGRCK